MLPMVLPEIVPLPSTRMPTPGEAPIPVMVLPVTRKLGAPSSTMPLLAILLPTPRIRLSEMVTSLTASLTLTPVRTESSPRMSKPDSTMPLPVSVSRLMAMPVVCVKSRCVTLAPAPSSDTDLLTVSVLSNSYSPASTLMVPPSCTMMSACRISPTSPSASPSSSGSDTLTTPTSMPVRVPALISIVAARLTVGASIVSALPLRSKTPTTDTSLADSARVAPASMMPEPNTTSPAAAVLPKVTSECGPP